MAVTVFDKITKKKFKVAPDGAAWNYLMKNKGGLVTLEFHIPEKLLSINQWSNLHWSKKARHKENVQLLVWASCKALKFRPILNPVAIEITGYFPTNKRRDIDNYSGGSTIKAILDGLVQAKIIPDDDSKTVKELKVKLAIAKYPRTKILIEEIDGQNP